MKKQKNKQNKNITSNAKKKSEKRQHHTQFYYSFLTIILLLCLAQISFSAILNISKIISYKQKIATISKTEEEAELRNAELKKDIKNFSSVATLESIARNNLKMAGQDEVLIIINKKVEDTKSKKKNWNLKNRVSFRPLASEWRNRSL